VVLVVHVHKPSTVIVSTSFQSPSLTVA
jgi:hypothetical protein